jgi:hypothetical protein
MKIKPGGGAVFGYCDIQIEKICIAAQSPEPVAVVFREPDLKQINVCSPCMKKKLETKEWEIEGYRPTN